MMEASRRGASAVAVEDRADCCMVGGGPAGAFLGLLLARAGVRVTLLEERRDLARQFRGETVHLPTLALLEDLGLLDRVLAHARSRSDRFQGYAPGAPTIPLDGLAPGTRHPT
jgi:2-polyprenyl-6-methoxyphenol hydroxylase-like FAD-dependent oxidoreductase